MKVLLLNQCFWPDVVATAQQLTDLARGLAERGHEVTVITGRRGYDNPSLKFPRRERHDGIVIHRVPAIAGEKNSRWRRALTFASFLLALAFRLVLTPRQDVVVALTSPPLISWLASLFTRIKGGRLVFWVMDLNPDEAIAAGWLKSDSIAAKLLGSLLKKSMRRSEKIVVLDRFMRQRILGKEITAEKIEVIPPWSHDDLVHYDVKGREVFRREHGFGEKFVVMYAGNHSPCHPLDTFLEAAKNLRERDNVVFCFAGGGTEVSRVKDFARANALNNIRVLPYQPRENLAALLSAADLHVVVMGNAFAGIVHPCKIYNILAIGTPFLYIGPGESHLSDINAKFSNQSMVMHAAHGDVRRVVELISAQARKHDRFEAHQPTTLAQEFSRSVLLPRFVAQLESLCPEVTTNPAEPAGAKLQSV